MTKKVIKVILTGVLITLLTLGIYWLVLKFKRN